MKTNCTRGSWCSFLCCNWLSLLRCLAGWLAAFLLGLLIIRAGPALRVSLTVQLKGHITKSCFQRWRVSWRFSFVRPNITCDATHRSDALRYHVVVQPHVCARDCDCAVESSSSISVRVVADLVFDCSFLAVISLWTRICGLGSWKLTQGLC